MFDIVPGVLLPGEFPLSINLQSSDIILVVFGLAIFAVVIIAIIHKKTGNKHRQQRQLDYQNITDLFNNQYNKLPYVQPQQQTGEPLPTSDDELFQRMARARDNAKKQISTLLIGALVCIPLFMFFPPLGVLIVVAGIIYFAKNSRINEYKTLYKENIVRKALARHFQNVTYSPFTGMHPGQIRNTGLIRLGATFQSEDYIKGTHLGVDFEQADINTYTRRDKSTTTYLRGRWIVLKLNKTIDSVMCVYDKSFPYYRSAPSMSYDWEKIELEDVAFNEKYCVIASNPHSAFYVLTPQVMSNLSKITAYMGNGEHLPLAFFMYGNEVHIAVSNAQNAFEISTSEPLDKVYMEQKIANEVQLITDVINIFTKYF